MTVLTLFNTLNDFSHFSRSFHASFNALLTLRAKNPMISRGGVFEAMPLYKERKEPKERKMQKAFRTFESWKKLLLARGLADRHFKRPAASRRGNC
jgi:hypothetical protein